MAKEATSIVAFKVKRNARGLDSRAVAMAGKISAETLADLDLVADAVKTKKMSALVVLSDIQRDFTADDIASFPVPGSYASADLVPKNSVGIISANNPDIFNFWNEETKKDQRGSFYADLIIATKRGGELKNQLEALAAAEGKKSGFDPKLAALGKDAMETLKADLTDAFNSFKGTFSRAVELILQMKAFDDVLKGKLAYEIMKNKEGEYLGGAKPIKVYDDSKKQGISDVFSVSSFLSFDVDTTLANGGTFEALLKTLKRDGEEPTGDGIDVTSLEEMDSAFGALAAYLGKLIEDEKQEKALYKYLTSAGKGGLIQSLFKVNAILDDIVVKKDIVAIHNKAA